MQEAQTTTAEKPAASCASTIQRSRSRLWLIGGGGALAVGAAALYGGWDWLVASGTGVVLLGLAPCIAMCAAGLCMGREKK